MSEAWLVGGRSSIAIRCSGVSHLLPPAGVGDCVAVPRACTIWAVDSLYVLWLGHLTGSIPPSGVGGRDVARGASTPDLSYGPASKMLDRIQEHLQVH